MKVEVIGTSVKVGETVYFFKRRNMAVVFASNISLYGDEGWELAGNLTKEDCDWFSQTLRTYEQGYETADI